MNYLLWKTLRTMILKQSMVALSSLPCKKVILCPGQSSQYIGMMNIVGKNTKIQKMARTANQILGYDIIKICQHGPEELLSRTIYCQPAVVVASLLAFEMLKENAKLQTGCDLMINSIAGFSVGEVSALHMAGVLDFDKAIVLLKERASVMDYASNLIPSGMLAMQGLSFEQAKELCENLTNLKNDPSHHVSVAIEQSPNSLSLGGSIVMLNKILNREHDMLADRQKVKLAMVNVGGAFHTKYMLPAQEQFNDVLSKMDFQHTNMDIYCNVTGKKYDFVNENISDLLTRQIAEPVLWNTIIDDIKTVSAESTMELYEVGPGKQLKAILSKLDRNLIRKVKNVSL